MFIKERHVESIKFARKVYKASRYCILGGSLLTSVVRDRQTSASEAVSGEDFEKDKFGNAMGIFVKLLRGLLLLHAVFSPALCRELIDPPGCGLPPKFWGVTVTDNAPLGSNPWLALIMFEGKQFDSSRLGALINHRYVVTTASGLNGTIDYVRLGEQNITSDPDCEFHFDKLICAEPVRDFKVEKIIRHPEFDEWNSENDFALIRLNQEVVYSDWVYPICICEVFEGSTLQIATYFHRKSISTFSTDILEKTNEVEIIPSRNCKDVYPEITEKHHVCTNYNSTYEKHDIGSPFIHYKGDGGGRYCLASLLKTDDFVNNNPSELLSCQFKWLENSMME